jgi:hypothetical protein
MPPIGPIILTFIVLALVVCACLFALAYSWNRQKRPTASAPKTVDRRCADGKISPTFYLAVLSSVALTVLAYIVNHVTLLKHFSPQTPGRAYWSNVDAIIASVPYVVLLVPALMARTRVWILAVLIALAVVMAIPYLRELLSPAPVHIGVYDDYELVVIVRIILHSALVLLLACCVAGWALGRRNRSAGV